MRRRTTYHLNSICGIIGIIFISLFITSPVTAQNHLTPGYRGNLDSYELALKTVFRDAYDVNVRARVQIKGKFGIENMTGIRADSVGYHLFYLIPDESVWMSNWVDVPCRDSDGNKIPKNPGKTCKMHNFSSVDTMRVNNFQTAIDTSLAQMLISLWEEMLVRSSYRKETNRYSTRSPTYQYSAIISGFGDILGYSTDPMEGTILGEFAAISQMMRNAARAESHVNADSLLYVINTSADSLLAKLLQYGENQPSKTLVRRTINGCTYEYRKMVESKYCWQTYLTDENIPNLIIANNNTGEYLFELVDISDLTDIRKIQILPVDAVYRRGDNFSGWQNYLLEPWDIVDLMINTHSLEFQVFGYRKFTLENENIPYNSDSVIIQFDGLFSNRDKRIRLDIDGEHEWFGIQDLFKDD